MNALEFWDRFHEQIEIRIRQCNAAAGKAVWISRSYGPFVHQINLESESRAAHRIECSFDLDHGILHCRPGPALPIAPFQFRWTGGTDDVLLLDGKEFALNAAVKIVVRRLTDLSNPKRTK